MIVYEVLDMYSLCAMSSWIEKFTAFCLCYCGCKQLMFNFHFVLFKGLM